MSRLRVPEWVKNLLILLLSLSALWLLTRSPLYVGSPLQVRVQALFSSAEPGGQTSAVALTAAARPTRICVVNGDGRYGVQYDAEAVDAAFDSLGSLLGEALATAGSPTPISETRWRHALLEQGAYFDFSGSIPFSALSGWLRGGEVNDALSYNVRRVALSYGSGENDVWLFWQDADTGAFYTCTTALDRALHLLPALAVWLPNGAFFAFEDTAFNSCAPYTLITATPTPAVYAASTPLAAGDAAVEQVLEALSYSAASGASYAISDGTRYTDGNNTFLLTNSGSLTYHAVDSRYPIAGGEETSTAAQCIEVTRKLAADTLGALCGEARLYLISAQTEGAGLVITYGYSLDGAPVFLYDGGWAARFVIENGAISSFTLHFRSYTATAAVTSLLPELLAAAAMAPRGAEGKELTLSYRDAGGESVTAGWAAS